MVTVLQHTLVKLTLSVAAKAVNSKYPCRRYFGRPDLARTDLYDFLAKRKCILNTSMKNSKDSHKLTSILSSKIIIIILNYFKLNINSVLLVTCHPNKYRFKAKLFILKNLHTKVLRQIVTVRLKVLKLF